MSTTIDQRVVEMRFDNKHFESNVSTTMSSLDKLKQKLHLPGATKGLEDVNAAAKKVDMSGISNSVETVGLKFNAMYTIADQALRNITNSAMAAGKRIADSLTIAPIKTGFQEYETQMNAVQTILANTQSKGSTLDDVNEALDTLNTYADKTIYNFTEMTRNIGTFTAAGVDLQTSVDSIQGIANLAAVSGSTSQQASTAMYQLSQALAAGRVSLMDWNSVVNAGMGGELFQNALLRTSELLKTGGKEAVKTYGSFRESLTKGQWLTTEVLTETLKQLSGAYSEADLIAQGFTKEQAKEITQLAKTATDAATKVKTFSQLWDVMKESAQSGWAQTWKLIIGDFEQAKSLLTPLADFMTGVIGKMSDARNKLIESALGKGFSHMFEGLNNVLNTTKKGIDGVLEPVKNASDALDNLGAIVDKVLVGSFGNGRDRVKALTEAGHNYYRVQNKVNETLGNSFRYSEEQIAAQDKLLGKQAKATEKTKEQADKTRELTREEKVRLYSLTQLSEEQLKAKGYTEEQIEAIKELKDQADKLGIPVAQFIENLDKINGRWLLINSFKNIGQGIVAVFTAMKDAYRSIFPPMSADQLFDIIGGFHKLSTYFKVNKDTANDLERTFKGVFAALDIVLTVVSGPLKIGFKVLSEILGMFDMDILDLTANIGDAIVGFKDWIDNTLDFTKAFEKIMPVVRDTVNSIKDWFESLKDSDNIGQDIVLGLVNGLKTGAKMAWDAAVELGTKLIEGAKNILGIHSPSTAFFEIGKNVILGLVNGIKEIGSWVWDTLTTILSKAVEIVKNMDTGTLIASIIGGGLIIGLFKIGDALQTLASPLKGLGNMFEGVGDVLKSLKGALDSYSMGIKAKALKDVAIAIAILVGSLIALTFVDSNKIWPALGVMAGLATTLGILSFAISKFGATGGAIKMGAFAIMMLSLATSLLFIAGAIKILETVDAENVSTVLDTLLGIALMIGVILAAFGTLVRGESAKNISKLGGMMFKLSAALLMMTLVIMLISGMKPDKLEKGLLTIAAFSAIILSLTMLSKFGGRDVNNIGSTISKIAGAMIMMTMVVMMVSFISPSDIAKGIITMAAFSGIVGLLVYITKFAGHDVKGIGRTLFAISGAILLMGVVVRMLGGMDAMDIAKGLIAIAGLAGIVAGLVYATKFAGQNLKGIGVTLLAMSMAIGILAGLAILLGYIDIGNFAKGFIAVGLLAGLVSMMAIATKNAKDVKGTMVAMSIAIAAMVGAVIALSLLDPKKLMTSVGALSILMGAFALVVGATKFASGIQGLWKTLVSLLAVTVILAGIVTALSFVNAENALPNVLALSILLTAFSGSLFILAKAGNISATVSKQMLPMLLVVAGLAAILSAMSFLPNPDALLPAAISLSILLTALAASLVILSYAGPLASLAVQPAMLMGLVIAELAIVLGLMSKLTNTEALLPTAAALSLLLIALSAACVILAPIGMTGPAALVGAGVLAGVIAILGAVAIAIGELMSYIPQNKIDEWKTGINKFMELLSTLAYGLGQVIGSFVGGMLDGVLSGLPAIGKHLSDFMTNAQPFIDSVKTVDMSVLSGVGILAGAIIALTAADFINGVATFMSGGTSFSELGAELSGFYTNAQTFLEGAKTITPETAEGVKNLASAILTLTAANLVESLTSWFAGETSLADFGKELEAFGPSMAAYSQAVAGIDAEAVKGSAEAAKTLAEMASALPNSGGVAGFFAGENDMSLFGPQLVEFGKSLKQYGIEVTGIATEAIKLSVDAAKSLSEMAASIPNMGGVVSFFTGDNDLSTFGTQLVSFGGSLKEYSIIVTGLMTESIAASVKATKSLASMASDIPNMGGVVGFFTGDNDLATFGVQLVTFGSGLKSYAQSVTGLNIDAIDDSVSAARSLASLAKALPSDGGFWSLFKDDTISMSDFGDEIVKLGEGIKGYSDEVSGTDLTAISSSITASERIAKLIKGIADIDTSGVSPFVTAIGTLGKASIDKFVEAFSTSTTKLNTIGSDMINAVAQGIQARTPALSTAMTSAIVVVINMLKSRAALFMQTGILLMTAFTEGLSSQRGRLSSAVTTSIVSSITVIRGYYSSFYGAGSYLVDGFAAGISANAYKAKAKSRAMAKAALQAAEEALGIESPSKEFYRVGDFSGQGFVNALNDYATTSYSAAYEMGDSAKSGLGDAIAKIQKVINGEMDTQPTIRPVLDLSDIRSGANTLSGLFGSGSSIGVRANIGAISASMSARHQNGPNDDVISAINKLRDNLENVGNTTYSINGVTYDDGSNITNAVKTIVRAARIERRV